MLIDKKIKIKGKDYHLLQMTETNFIIENNQNSYDLETHLKNGELLWSECSCPAYKYSRTSIQSCKHTKALEDILLKEKKLPIKKEKRYPIEKLNYYCLKAVDSWAELVTEIHISTSVTFRHQSGRFFEKVELLLV